MGSLKMKLRRYWNFFICHLFGKVSVVDKFGIRHFLWADTRLARMSVARIATDDEGVLINIERIGQSLDSRNELLCVDVGAYIGIVSLYMARAVGSTGRVFSFEPSRKNFDRLKMNSRLAFDVILPINKFVSDVDDRDFMIANNVDPGMTRLANEGDGSNVERVRSITLDSFAAENSISKISVLKVDTEGHELAVFQGAKGLLANRKIQSVIFEVNSNDQEIFKLLKAFGFEIFYIVRNTGRLAKSLVNYPADHKSPLNVLAIQRELIGKVEFEFID